MEKKFDFKSVLSETEQSALEKVANNPDALSALRKVILADTYFNGVMEKGVAPEPNRNFFLNIIANTPDENLVDAVKSAYQAVSLVESGLKNVETFKTPETVEIVERNNAR